jgi:hypothetical protein
MNELVPISPPRGLIPANGPVAVPAVIADAGDHASRRLLEFFAATRPSRGQPAAAVGVGPRPRQQLVDPRRRPRVDEPGQDVGEIGLRSDTVQLAGFDQRSEAGPVLGSRIVAGEQGILPI